MRGVCDGAAGAGLRGNLRAKGVAMLGAKQADAAPPALRLGTAPLETPGPEPVI